MSLKSLIITDRAGDPALHSGVLLKAERWLTAHHYKSHERSYKDLIRIVLREYQRTKELEALVREVMDSRAVDYVDTPMSWLERAQEVIPLAQSRVE